MVAFASTSVAQCLVVLSNVYRPTGQKPWLVSMFVCDWLKAICQCLLDSVNGVEILLWKAHPLSIQYPSGSFFMSLEGGGPQEKSRVSFC